MLDKLDMVPFGLLPFDLYLMDKWDPNSPLTKIQQFRALVHSWVRLGKRGRNKYPDGEFLSPEEIPPHVPQDLMSDEHRAKDGQTARTLWIRTWFGQENDPISQNAANAGYNRLRSILDENDIDSFLDEDCFFDDEAEFGPGSITIPEGYENGEFIDGVACGTPWSVPLYMITALMHKPDTLDGNSDRDWPKEWYQRDDLFDLNTMQCMMVLVADRKACEEGWVLFFVVNEKGEVLPFRVREKVDGAVQVIACYMNGQWVNEGASYPEEDIEYYMDEGDGWDC